MNETNMQKSTQPGQYRPSLALFHASPKGTGGAIKMTLHPAHDDTDGCIMLTMANQLTIGNRQGPNPVYPKFDWDGKLTVKLDFTDLTKMLQVFRGECESIEDGKGLYHTTAQFTTCQQIWKTQQWPQDWKRSDFIQISKKGKPKNVQSTAQLHSSHRLAK